VNSLKQTLKKINWLTVVITAAMLVFATLPILVPSDASAQLNRNFPCDPSTGLRCTETSLPQLFRTIINWALGIAFGLAVIFLIIGGFRYLTAGGNEGAAEAGRKYVINALIGIVIIILSYVIVNIVANFVQGNNTGFFGG
jgi:hypothetical protein